MIYNEVKKLLDRGRFEDAVLLLASELDEIKPKLKKEVKKNMKKWI